MSEPRRITSSPPPASHAADDLTVPEQLLHERVRSLFSRDFLRSVLTQGRADLQDSKLSPAVVAVLLLTYVTERLPSFLSVLDKARAGLIGGLPALCATRQAFSQRLLAIGHTPFLRLLRETTRRLASAEPKRPWITPLAPFARGIYAVDDTTLDALVRRVDWLRAVAPGEPRPLAGKLGCVIDLSTGKLAEVLYNSDSAANEKSHIRPLLASFPAGALFVLDLGYFAYPFFDWMTKRAWYFVTRLRQGTSYDVLHVLADRPLYRDRIVYLGVHRADRAARPVRLVELLLDGAWWSYLTNVLDPEQLPADAVWRLYQERWTIEMCFAALKRALGLASLRCSTIEGVLAQIWTTLTIYQVLQDLRLELAAAAGLGADDISWTNLTRHIAWYIEQPEGKPPLRTWLKDNATQFALAKRGTRPRRARQLDPEIMASIREPRAALDLTVVQARRPRQGKPEPVRPSMITVAGLRTSTRRDELGR
jgi:hypothetical protein